MQHVTVNYSVSRSVALSEGRSDFGTAAYQPSDTELQFLCLADRTYLDQHDHETFHLLTAVPPTWPVIVDAIRAARLAAEAATEKARADLELTILAALAKPDEEWLSKNGFGEVARAVPGWGWYGNVPDSVRNDPRVAARLESLVPEIDRRNTEREAARKAEQAKRDAAKAAKDAARESAVESVRQWALASADPALARSARDGYDIANAVLQRVADTLANEICGEVSVEGTAHWRRWDLEERSAPSLAAFEAYDHVKQAIAELDKPAGVVVELDRISRVTVEPADETEEDAEHYTAIVVFITLTGYKSRAVILRVE